MNRGYVLQSSPVQQMMAAAGGPNWWSISSARPPPPLPPPSTFMPSSFQQFPPPPPYTWHDDNNQLQEFPESWSNLLMGGLVGEEDKLSQLQAKKLENWEEQLLHNQHQHPVNTMADLNEENTANNYGYGGHGNADFHGVKPGWTSPMIPVSSPKSCVTSLSSNMLDFTSSKTDVGRHPPPDHTSECNSSITRGANKKAKIQPSSTQPTFKVRKEKLGDRITALHQLVSPFGKTDTASVLLEAIGYIRFLQSQIEALSLPYLGSGSGGNINQQQHTAMNENTKKRKGGPDQQDRNEEAKDLKSRGLCLVPVACTMQVGNENGADYWAPALNRSFR